MDDGVRIGKPPPAPAVPSGSLHSLLRWWPLLVAGLLMAGLLLALASVSRDAVAQAQARHATTAARADANFRCSTMAGIEQRKDCRARADGLLVDTASSRP